MISRDLNTLAMSIIKNKMSSVESIFNTAFPEQKKNNEDEWVKIEGFKEESNKEKKTEQKEEKETEKKEEKKDSQSEDTIDPYFK